MRVNLKFSAVVLTVLLSFAGCSTQPIMNINGAIVAPKPGNAVTKEQVRAAIVLAGGSVGWQMTDDGADKLVGTLALRTHTAVVDIPYSKESYSIVYKSSVNLHEKDGQIHKNYNGWIQNLSRSINTQLGKL